MTIQPLAASAQVTSENIMKLGTAFFASKALLSAVELGVFTALADGGLPADDLREKLGLHERSALDFFDALVALGMLEREEGIYRNTAETDHFLDRNKASYIGGILEMANRRLYGFWGALTTGLQTGKPQNEISNGEDLFETLYGDPERLSGIAEGRFPPDLRGAHRR